MINKTLFMSKECPEGFFLPRTELIAVNLLDGTIGFKSKRYLYSYSFNTTVFTMVNIKTLNKMSLKLDGASLEDKKEFERIVLEDLGIYPDKAKPDMVMKGIEELGIYPGHLIMFSDMEYVGESEDDE